jgi:pyruvate/oxaloacetate carboxyltransferase
MSHKAPSPSRPSPDTIYEVMFQTDRPQGTDRERLIRAMETMDELERRYNFMLEVRTAWADFVARIEKRGGE